MSMTYIDETKDSRKYNCLNAKGKKYTLWLCRKVDEFLISRDEIVIDCGRMTTPDIYDIVKAISTYKEKPPIVFYIFRKFTYDSKVDDVGEIFEFEWNGKEYEYSKNNYRPKTYFNNKTLNNFFVFLNNYYKKGKKGKKTNGKKHSKKMV